MRIAPAAVAVALAAGAATFAHEASGGPLQARTFDQTLYCETALIGGVHEVSARAHRGTRRAGVQWRRPPFAGFTSGKIGDIDSLLDTHLVWIVAGRPAANAYVVEHPYTTMGFPVREWGTLAWSTKRCRATAKPVSMSTAGLEGGAAGPFDDEFDCATPRRVAVRLQATLATRAAPKRSRRFTAIKTPLTKARIMIRTESGRAVAYAEVHASGKARVLTGSGCFPS